MEDLAGRLAGRVQLSTDGFRPYVQAIDRAFGIDVDYAQLLKVYANPKEELRQRYSPSECIGAVPISVTGWPDPDKICTSHVERSNLTMRTFLRRLTRLCPGFSKKLENMKSAIALYFAWYNFVRIHGSLRVTPAMEAGLTDHVWSLGELIGTGLTSTAKQTFTYCPAKVAVFSDRKKHSRGEEQPATGCLTLCSRERTRAKCTDRLRYSRRLVRLATLCFVVHLVGAGSLAAPQEPQSRAEQWSRLRENKSPNPRTTEPDGVGERSALHDRKEGHATTRGRL